METYKDSCFICGRDEGLQIYNYYLMSAISVDGDVVDGGTFVEYKHTSNYHIIESSEVSICKKCRLSSVFRRMMSEFLLGVVPLLIGAVYLLNEIDAVSVADTYIFESNISLGRVLIIMSAGWFVFGGWQHFLELLCFPFLRHRWIEDRFIKKLIPMMAKIYGEDVIVKQDMLASDPGQIKIVGDKGLSDFN